MTLVRVTDRSGAGSATVEHYDVAAAVTPWFAAAPIETVEAVASLQDALNSFNGDAVDYLADQVGVDIAYLT